MKLRGEGSSCPGRGVPAVRGEGGRDESRGDPAVYLDATQLRRSQRHQAPLAAALEAHVPPGETVHVALWQEFNLLFLVDRPMRYLDDPQGTPASAYLLIRADALESFEARAPAGFEIAHEFDGPRSGSLLLLRTGDGRP